METPPTLERRTERSTDALVALSRLFEAARQRNAFEAVVLSDDTGIAIAGAGVAEQCDELAAGAAVLSGPPANDTVPSRLDVVSRTARIRRLRIDGIEVLLCADGPSSASEDALRQVAEGCRRILSEGRPRAAAMAREAARGPLGFHAFDVAKGRSAT